MLHFGSLRLLFWKKVLNSPFWGKTRFLATMKHIDCFRQEAGITIACHWMMLHVVNLYGYRKPWLLFHDTVHQGIDLGTFFVFLREIDFCFRISVLVGGNHRLVIRLLRQRNPLVFSDFCSFGCRIGIRVWNFLSPDCEFFWPFISVSGFCFAESSQNASPTLRHRGVFFGVCLHAQCSGQFQEHFLVSRCSVSRINRPLKSTSPTWRSFYFGGVPKRRAAFRKCIFGLVGVLFRR